jgi:hypothetical protein
MVIAHKGDLRPRCIFILLSNTEIIYIQKGKKLNLAIHMLS